MNTVPKKKVVLVSIPKAGTHLVTRLLEGLGYRLRWRLGHEVAGLDRPERWQRELLELKEGTCLVVHRLTPVHLPRRFVGEWQEEDSIRILYHARDPRDVLVSGLHALGDDSDSRHQTAAFLVLAELLEAQGDRRSQVDFLLGDLPRSWTGDLDPLGLFRELDWLRLHPRVCNTRFEELVGPKGGGSRPAQVAAVRRVMEHLGAEGDAEALLAGLWSRQALTFRRGRIGSWREELDEAQAAKLAAELPELLAADAGSAADLRPRALGEA